MECLVFSTIGAGQIDLIDNRNNHVFVRHRQIHVGDGLGLNALCRIDQQQRTLAGRKAPRDLIGKVDVPRRIDQVQGVGVPVTGLVTDRHRMGLDGDPPLTLQIHRIENLVFGLSGRHSASGFEEPVSEG